MFSRLYNRITQAKPTFHLIDTARFARAVFYVEPTPDGSFDNSAPTREYGAAHKFEADSVVRPIPKKFLKDVGMQRYPAFEIREPSGKKYIAYMTHMARNYLKDTGRLGLSDKAQHNMGKNHVQHPHHPMPGAK